MIYELRVVAGVRDTRPPIQMWDRLQVGQIARQNIMAYFLHSTITIYVYKGLFTQAMEGCVTINMI